MYLLDSKAMCVQLLQVRQFLLLASWIEQTGLRQHGVKTTHVVSSWWIHVVLRDKGSQSRKHY